MTIEMVDDANRILRDFGDRMNTAAADIAAITQEEMDALRPKGNTMADYTPNLTMEYIIVCSGCHENLKGHQGACEDLPIIWMEPCKNCADANAKAREEVIRDLTNAGSAALDGLMGHYTDTSHLGRMIWNLNAALNKAREGINS